MLLAQIHTRTLEQIISMAEPNPANKGNGSDNNVDPEDLILGNENDDGDSAGGDDSSGGGQQEPGTNNNQSYRNWD